MNKSPIREETFKLIYSQEIQKDEKKTQINLYLENNNIENPYDRKYIINVTKGVQKKSKEIEEIISRNLKEGWSIERIAKIDLALLKLGIYEILYMDKPYKVIISEIVELAKRYGEETSPSFINGIIAKIVQIDEKISDGGQNGI